MPGLSGKKVSFKAILLKSAQKIRYDEFFILRIRIKHPCFMDTFLKKISLFHCCDQFLAGFKPSYFAGRDFYWFACLWISAGTRGSFGY